MGDKGCKLHFNDKSVISEPHVEVEGIDLPQEKQLNKKTRAGSTLVCGLKSPKDIQIHHTLGRKVSEFSRKADIDPETCRQSEVDIRNMTANEK